MKLISFTFAIILLFSCNKHNTEEIYIYELNVIGNTIQVFSEKGEEREYIIQLTSIPDISTHEAELFLKSSKIDFMAENHNFFFSDYVVKDNAIKFKIRCKENVNKKTVDDKISITVINQKFSLNETFDLSQASSDIRYEYKIESEITKKFTFPDEGGLFTIPLKSKRLKYINGNYALEEPCSLKGVRYISSCINGAWVHTDRIYNGKAVGDYIIELNATQPFNVDGEFSWSIELLYNELSIFHLEIIHNQTPGDEYYIGDLTRFNSEIIE
ncbi:hypothetical protein [Proteiniphilum sp.]|uniref:hypothetical protein n=1 Tax=Proteiniphilum sp. TaxID=1926877 RepID=UPI003325E97D